MMTSSSSDDMAIEQKHRAAVEFASHIPTIVSALRKLKSAAKRGDGVALTHPEVEAVMLTLNTLRQGVRDDRPTT
jgi:hypothetical protein